MPHHHCEIPTLSNSPSAPALKRHGGELIHHGRDEVGVIEVVDAHGVRSLHFGTSARQSAMSLQNPDRLELGYIRAMLSALLFCANPRNALLIGLGGGSLARFLLRQFPACQVDALERRAMVAEIAHNYFGLPRNERLTVRTIDACRWVEAQSIPRQGMFDLILVDAYDHLGMDPAINAADFFDACIRMLHRQGVLSINLWGSHPVSFRRSVALLRAGLPGRALKLAVPNRGNVIVLGLGEGTAAFVPKTMEIPARRLEIETGLEMTYFLRNLRPL